MKRVKLRVKEDIKYETIKSCVDHKSPVIAASIKLNLSRRQIFRLINVYKKRGKEGFIHGNRDRKPINTLNKTLSTKIIQLVNKKYKDNNSNYLILNYSHLQDMLKEKHNISISYASLYTLMLKNNFLSPKIQKITKRKIAKEKLIIKKPNTKPEDIEIIVNHIVELEDAHPRKERAKYFGELLQMDACSKIWGNSFFATLHLAIDNSTGNIVGGYFCKEETLLGYYQIFSQILHNYGIPIKIITDKRTVFTYKQLKKR